MHEVVQSYRFALDPSESQEQMLLSHCGAARFAYNYLLGSVIANIAQREAERSYGIAESDLTPAIGWSFISLRNLMNANKAKVAPWWRANSKESLATGARALADALAAWKKARNGQRAGIGFPTFKSVRRAKPSYLVTTGFHLNDDRHSIYLPRIGRIHTHESTRKLSRRLSNGTARVTSARVTRQGGRWFVSFTAYVQRAEPVHSRPGSVVGIDMGVRDLVVAAAPDGDEVLRVPVPERLRLLERRAAILQRAARRKVNGSRRKKRVMDRIARLHRAIADLRTDTLHKVTTHLTRSFETVVIEDLAVANMMSAGGAHKCGLNRSIGRASLATIRHMIEYKTAREGGSAVVVDRFYPSSKTCSGCGTVKAKLSLAERTYVCEVCGTMIDRDLNAAINLSREWPGDRTWPTDARATVGRGSTPRSHAEDGDLPAAGVEASTPPGDRVLATVL